MPATLAVVAHSPEEIEWSLVGGSGQTLLLDGGRATGSAGCDRSSAAIRSPGSGSRFEPLATTRMACEPEVMRAESDYLAALGRVERVSIEKGSSRLRTEKAPSYFGSSPTRREERPSRWS